MPTKATSKKRRPQSAKRSTKPHYVSDVAITPYDPATGTDAEECFLPLLMLGLGLWGGSKALRGRSRGFGMPGMGMGMGGAGMGAGPFGGGSGMPGMTPGAGPGMGSGMGSGMGAGMGVGGPWGGPWGSIMTRRGIGGMTGWPFSGMGGGAYGPNGMNGAGSPFWF